MSRYIEENHLVDNLYLQADDDGYICCPVEDLEKMIKAEPTTDVRENKHGDWVRRFEGTIAEGTFCNQCWRSTHRRTNFCPNCGADMRKEVEEWK